MRFCMMITMLAGMLFAPTAHAQPTLSRTDLETVLAPNPLVSTDVDNDGDMDILTVSHSFEAWLAVHLNNGSGVFDSTLYALITEDAPGGFTDLAVGDLDQDGNLDLVVSHYSSWTIYIYYGNGDGTFVAPSTITNANNISAIVLADFSGDGWLDIGTVINADDATVGIFRSMSSGHAFATPVHYPCGIHARGMEVGDLNNDSEVDVLVANWQDAKFSVLLGNGTGGLDPYTQYSLPNWSYGLALANIVGDSNLDVAVTVTDYQGSTGLAYNQVRVYRGIGDGTLVFFDSILAAPYPLGIVAAQIEGDLALDLLWVGGTTGYLQIARNDGNGFASPNSFVTGPEPFELVVFDLDTNGKADVVTSNHGSHVLSIFYNESAIVCHDLDNDGYGDPGHSEDDCPLDNCPTIYNPGQEDWDNNGIGDACTQTDTGTAVVVQPTENITITYPTVTGSGTTGVTPSPTGPTPPANVGVVPLGSPLYYQIFVNGVSFEGNVLICINYNDSVVTGNEAELTLQHFVDGTWINITVSCDTVNNIICGETSSFSFFAITEACCFGPRGDVNADGTVTITDLVFLVQYCFNGGKTPYCLYEADVNGNGSINVLDIVYLVQYSFNSGTPPPTCPSN